MMCSKRPTTTCRHPAGSSKAALVIGLGVVVAAGTGCRNSPITENDQRSPYDRYDLIRDEYAPPYLEDEYGRKRPNLRGRLIDRR
jgi:hypothetical protein